MLQLTLNDLDRKIKRFEDEIESSDRLKAPSSDRYRTSSARLTVKSLGNAFIISFYLMIAVQTVFIFIEGIMLTITLMTLYAYATGTDHDESWFSTLMFLLMILTPRLIASFVVVK